MRKLFYILLSAFMTLTSLVSCGQEPEEVNPDPSVEPSAEPSAEPSKEPSEEPTGPFPGTYIFTASELKGSWEAGDQIYIHGSYGPAAQTVTLTESQISEDGKTASVELSGNIFEFPLKPDGLYAAFPADAVIPATGLTGVTTEFEKVDVLLCVAYLDGDTFNFKDASSSLTFQVSGDYDRFAIAGNKRPGLRISSYPVDYTSSNYEFTTRKSDGYPFLEGTVSDGSAEFWFPGTITLSGGFTLYLAKGDDWCATYSVSDNFRLKAGQITDIGDITSGLTEYTGLAPKMPEMGKRTKYTVQVNEVSGLCLSEEGGFLWAVGDGGELVKLSYEGEVLEKKKISGDTEAVSRDLLTGDLLFAMEPHKVAILHGPDLLSSKVETLFFIADAKSYSNAGLEGLTYYKDRLLYAGAQTAAELYLCDFEKGEVLSKMRLIDMYSSILEIADLCYDPLTDWLWVIDSEARKIFVLTGDASQMLGSYSVRGIQNPESVCVDHDNSCVWVADDYGDVSYLYRFDFTGLDDAIIVEE